MPKRSRKSEKSQVDVEELVTVALAEDMEQAKNYATLLKADNIPAVIKEQNDPEKPGAKGIAIMVPEEFFDEAHVVIESQDAYDDFYDFASENENDDFEGADLEDDF